MQFGKGYKREIYDNAPWGGWLLVSAGGGGWKRKLGVRDRWGLGVVPIATLFPPSPARTTISPPPTSSPLDLRRPTARTRGGRYLGAACPTSVATPESCACHGRHCVRTCVLARPRLIPGFRIWLHHSIGK